MKVGHSIFPHDHYAFWHERPTINHHLFSVVVVALSDMRIGFESNPRSRSPSIAHCYSAATGDATLGELAEWDPKFAEPFAPGAFISASGLSERRDFPSK